MRKVYLLILLLAVSGIVNAQTNWELLNPKPSDQTALAMHFVDAQNGFIINEKQLIQTTDAGINWQVMRNIPSGKAMAFKNATGVIAGLSGEALFTTDSGLTWQTLETNNSISYNSVSVIDDNTFILSGEYQICKTTDGGLNWSIYTIPNGGHPVNKTVFVSAMVGCAFGENGSILRTTNGGQTWSVRMSTNEIPSAFLTAYFVDENIGFASREHQVMYKTVNGGLNWTEMPGTIFPIYTFFFLNSNLGYGCGKNGVVYKTSDGGVTWAYIPFQDALYVDTNMYAIYFTDENNGYVSGMKGIIEKTVTGGTSWTSHSPTYDDVVNLIFTTPQTGYAFASGGIFKTNDAGNNWAVMNPISENDYPAVTDFVSPDVAYALAANVDGTGNRDKIYKTIDAGAHWTLLPAFAPLWFDEDFYCIDFSDENIGLVSGGWNQRGTFRTTDGGFTWQSVNEYSFSRMKFVSASTVYATVYASNRIYKSTDAGLTWNVVFFTDSENMNYFDFSDENNGYFGGENGAMFKTSDGGLNWQQLVMPYGHYYYIKMYNTNLVYAADNWEGNFYRSTDHGQTWENLMNFPGVRSVVFNGNSIYFSATAGRILRASLSPNLTVGGFESDDAALSVFPNPASNQVNITSEDLDIKNVGVFTIAGQEIELSAIRVNPKTMALDVSGLASGLYLVAITLEDTSKITKKLQVN